jgi:hypothetical protein
LVISSSSFWNSARPVEGKGEKQVTSGEHMFMKLAESARQRIFYRVIYCSMPKGIVSFGAQRTVNKQQPATAEFSIINYFANVKYILIISCLCAVAVESVPTAVMADEPAAPALTATPSSTATPATGTRHGLFDWLDQRSDYGQGVFPEPFLVDDSDLETGEARLDWLHTGGNDQHSDIVTAEVEKGFGLLTLELEVPYERDTADGQTSQGMGNIDLGARYPLYQFVSGNGFVDSTLGTAIEVGIPVNSAVSKNTELVPKIFDDLKLGEHFTLQSILGWSKLFGGGDAGGLQSFEYGFVFGYTIPHEEIPLPGVQQFIPVFELIGDTQLNQDDPGHNSLLGDLGFRLNLKTIGPIQPRPGLGFVFPIDEGARADLHWGFIASLVFEF